MISLSYVNERIPESPILNEFELFRLETSDLEDDITTMFGQFNSKYYMLVTEAEIMGDDSALQSFLEEAEENNVFSKIGKKVETLVQTILKFISNIIGKIKDMAFGQKSDIAKVEALCKKHPELQDKILKAFESGDLSVRDVKSFAELDKEFNEILRLSTQANQNPNSLKARWNRAIENFNNSSTAKTIAVTGAIAGSITAVYKLGQAISKNSAETTRKAKESLAKFTEYEQEHNVKIKELEAKGMHEFRFYMLKGYNSSVQDVLQSNYTTMDKIKLRAAKVLDKFSNLVDKDVASSAIKNQVDISRVKSKKEQDDKQRDDEIKEYNRRFSRLKVKEKRKEIENKNKQYKANIKATKARQRASEEQIKRTKSKAKAEEEDRRDYLKKKPELDALKERINNNREIESENRAARASDDAAVSYYKKADIDAKRRKKGKFTI